jgi:hypothetical protein
MKLSNNLRLTLAALMAAHKYTDDNVIHNYTIAHAFGMTTSDLFEIEGEFLQSILWETSINEEKLESYSKELEDYVGSTVLPIESDDLSSIFPKLRNPSKIQRFHLSACWEGCKDNIGDVTDDV